MQSTASTGHNATQLNTHTHTLTHTHIQSKTSTHKYTKADINTDAQRLHAHTYGKADKLTHTEPHICIGTHTICSNTCTYNNVPITTHCCPLCVGHLVYVKCNIKSSFKYMLSVDANLAQLTHSLIPPPPPLPA